MFRLSLNFRIYNNEITKLIGDIETRLSSFFKNSMSYDVKSLLHDNIELDLQPTNEMEVHKLIIATKSHEAAGPDRTRQLLTARNPNLGQ